MNKWIFTQAGSDVCQMFISCGCKKKERN